MRVVVATHEDGYAPRLAEELGRRGHLARFHGALPPGRLRTLDLPEECLGGTPWGARLRRALGSLAEFGRGRAGAFEAAVAAGLRTGGANLLLTTPESSCRILDLAHAAGLSTVLLVQTAHVQERMCVRATEHRRLGLDWNPEALDHEALGELAAYEQADLLVAPTVGIRESFLERGTAPERVVVVPRARLGNLHPAPRPRGTFRILAEGPANLARGAHLLLQAFRELALEDAELVLAGPKDRELDPFLLRWGTDGVRFETGLDAVRRQELYQEASVYCAPHLAPGTGEGVLEALAFGLPVVTSEASAGREWVTDGREGRVVPRGRVEPLKEALRALHHDHRLARGMGEASLERAREAGAWEAHLTRLASVVEPLISKRRGRPSLKLLVPASDGTG